MRLLGYFKGPRALVPAFLLIIFWTENAHANYWEISANGSYMLYNNGLVNGDDSVSTMIRYGAGIAYHLSENTSIELAYTHSIDIETYSELSPTSTDKYQNKETTDFQNLALNLILDFNDKTSTFKPFIGGGVGYMERKILIATNDVNLTTGQVTPYNNNQPVENSASADATVGFKIFVADHVAIEASGTVIATDLAQSSIYLNYSLTGGLRFLF